MKAARHTSAAGTWRFAAAIAVAVAGLAAFLLLLHL
jgi:hypothetical protein